MHCLRWLLALALVAVFTVGAPTISSAQEGEAEEVPSEGEEVSGEGADDGTTLVQTANKRRWGVGARFRYVFVPTGVLELFLDHATSMSSVGFGVEVVGRKGNFDIVFGLEYDGVSPQDGLYQDKGDDPGQCRDNADTCPDFTRFDGLGVIGLDANFIWHTQLASKIHLRYGGGLGVGIVTGSVFQTKKFCPPGTTADDLDDASVCSMTLTGESEKESEDVPPVVPIISVLLGVKFQILDNLSLNVEGGFRDVFFLGAGTDYVF